LTEFDDMAIATLPIVKGGEIVTDGLEISQAILACARAFRRARLHQIGRSRSGRQTALAASVTRAGIW
jgi:hypothetical protein